MKAIFGFFRKRWVLTLLGLIVLSLLIWFVGPLFAFADYKPLDPESRRWILIGLLFAIWLARLAWGWLKRCAPTQSLLIEPGRRASAHQARRERATRRGCRNCGARMQDALGILKKMRVKERVRHALCLPAALVRHHRRARRRQDHRPAQLRAAVSRSPSGSGRKAIRGVGGTRNCDWWFTDDAVLLDTAGRYTTQDSDREVDKAAWMGFLELLKQQRGAGRSTACWSRSACRTCCARRRASASASTRHSATPPRAAPSSASASRSTCCSPSATCWPASWSSSATDREQRAQVWGITAPLTDQTRSGTLLADLPGQFDALEKRLQQPPAHARAAGARSSAARADLFVPAGVQCDQQGSLTNFLTEVFDATRFEERSMLRGIYFTSGTQEGTPHRPRDDLAGARIWAATKPAAGQCRQRARATSSTRLLKNVVFAEADLAGTNLRFERRRAWLTRGLTQVSEFWQ